MTFQIKVAFWLILAISVWFAIWPVPEPLREIGPDKVFHILAFAALAGVGRFAYPHLSIFQLGALLSGFGALIELIQALPLINRDAQLSDWVADTIAVVVVLAALQLVRRLRTMGR